MTNRTVHEFTDGVLPTPDEVRQQYDAGRYGHDVGPAIASLLAALDAAEAKAAELRGVVVTPSHHTKR